MTFTTTRARVAIGSALIAMAAPTAAGSLSAASQSAPPSTAPDPTEPAGPADAAASALDPERERLVEAIIETAGEGGFPLDRECVADLVAQVPDEDLAVINTEIASVEASPEVVTVTEQSVAVQASGAAIPETLAPAPDETTATEPTPSVSPLPEELGQQMITCASGDADPVLVDDALAAIQADADAPPFDIECVASLLTTFSEEALTLIAEGDGSPVDSAAGSEVADATVVPETAGPEPTSGSEPLDDAFAEVFSLLICAPDVLGGLGSIATPASAPAPMTVETIAVESSGAEPAESTAG